MKLFDLPHARPVSSRPSGLIASLLVACLVVWALLVLRGCMNAHDRPGGHADITHRTAGPSRSHWVSSRRTRESSCRGPMERKSGVSPIPPPTDSRPPAEDASDPLSRPTGDGSSSSSNHGRKARPAMRRRVSGRWISMEDIRARSPAASCSMTRFIGCSGHRSRKGDHEVRRPIGRVG
jgi:hypothetical protein